MRFSAVVFVAALAGMAASAPVVRRSLVIEVGAGVKSFEDAAGVTAAEDALDKSVGGAISKAEKKLGVTYAEEELGLAKRRYRGDIQTIGTGVVSIEDGTGITDAERQINLTSGGSVNALEQSVGVTDVEKAFGLARN